MGQSRDNGPALSICNDFWRIPTAQSQSHWAYEQYAPNPLIKDPPALPDPVCSPFWGITERRRARAGDCHSIAVAGERDNA